MSTWTPKRQQNSHIELAPVMNLCQHCDRTFATPSSLKRHISARHSSETNYHRQTRTTHQCPHCHEHFARRETVKRHVRSKHDGDLSTCSFCMKQFRADYMPQHRATCARKYWRKIEQYANPTHGTGVTQHKSRSCSSRFSPPSEFEEVDLHLRSEELPEAPDQNHTLRIVHENAIDGRLAADALAHMLLRFEEIDDVESYKAALATALHSNITVSILERTRQRNDRFYRLCLIATCFDEIVRGVRQINDIDNNLGTPILHAACRAGFAKILEPLFWRGACFDAVDRFHETPLDSAIRSRDLDTVRFVLALGSDPNQDSPLFDAYFANMDDAITLLVEHGADINQCSSNATLLSVAIERCDLESVRLVLSLGADPNVAHPMDDLISDCLYGECRDCVHEVMVRLLVEHGAEVTRQSREGHTVLHYAAIQGHAQLLRTGLNRINSPTILDMGDDDNDTPLYCATQALLLSHPQQALILTSMLLEAGADPNVQNIYGHSALMLAAREGSDELVQLLLDAGANVKSQCQYGQTALSYAADCGHNTTVGLLLENAPPTHEDSSYLTIALEHAFRGDHRDVVKQLISFGANCSAEEVLSLALESPTSEVERILVEAGA